MSREYVERRLREIESESQSKRRRSPPIVSGNPTDSMAIEGTTIPAESKSGGVSKPDVDIVSVPVVQTSSPQLQMQGKPDSEHPVAVLSSRPSRSAFRARSMTKPMNLTSEYDGEIRRLKNDLDHARRTIICLMPEPVQEILDSYYRSTSRVELHQWKSSVIDQLVELAKPVPRHTPYDTERAYCPLCGGSAQDFYQSQQGFSLPVGLHRHLEGWGNTHQCDVTVAAFGLAHDWAHNEFHETEQKERAEEDAKFKARRATETLYQIGPNCEPDLMGGRYQWRPVRDHESLSWAEERLEELGFKKVLQEKVKSYIQVHSGVVVYADPREEGRIDFLVYRFPTTPTPRKARRQPNFEPRPRFSLPDAWKHDLQGKYAARLAQAIDVLGVGQVAR